MRFSTYLLAPLKGVLVSDGDQHRPERSGESCHGFAALPKSAQRADFPLLRGERVPVGGRSPVENSAVASDIAERAPPGHSNRSDPFSFVNSVVAGRVPPAHSNRADRRESQGVSAVCWPAQFQFIELGLSPLIAHCSFLISHYPYTLFRYPAARACSSAPLGSGFSVCRRRLYRNQ